MFKPSFLSDEYLVCDKGYVLSKTGKPLKPSINHNGYQIVNLMINGKRKGIAIHTLVARAFCNGYKEGLTVNHRDGNKLNNDANNLEWITIKDNVNHAITVLGKRKDKSNNPNSKEIYAIDKNTGKKYHFYSLMDGAEFINPNANYKELRHIQGSIWRALNGLRKSYKGYYWQY